jgi:hypothetical protein
MRIIPLTLKEAVRFLDSRKQVYRVPRDTVLVVGIADEDGLHGVLIAGCNSGEEAHLGHVYSDGTPGGFSLLYGDAWRALKAMGYRRAVL